MSHKIGSAAPHPDAGQRPRAAGDSVLERRIDGHGRVRARRRSSTVTINFGDQQQELETLLTDSGALKGASYKVNFVEFDSGPLVDAGFAAHRIDVGYDGRPARVAGGEVRPAGHGDRGIAAHRRVGVPAGQAGCHRDLPARGKPVAYTTGTAEQAFALRALHSAGLTQKDVQQVNVTLQELGTALESGAAYASVVSVEQKVDYEQTHPKRGDPGHADHGQPGQLRLSPRRRPRRWPTRPSSRRSTTCSSAWSRPRTGRSPTRASGSPTTTSTSSTRRRPSPRSSSPRAAPRTYVPISSAVQARCSTSSR